MVTVKKYFQMHKPNCSFVRPQTTWSFQLLLYPVKDVFIKWSFHYEDIYIFVLILWLCGEKGLNDKVNFKFYVVIYLTNNYNTHIVQYAQRIQIPLQSCSWITSTLQHILPCQLVKILVRILCNKAHELKDPALGYIFRWTFLDFFQHILSLHSY